MTDSLELTRALLLARVLLEKSGLDPDSDICVLARQLHRTHANLVKADAVIHNSGRFPEGMTLAERERYTVDRLHAVERHVGRPR